MKIIDTFENLMGTQSNSRSFQKQGLVWGGTGKTWIQTVEDT